ncbi:hypothetical protein STENM327S_02743 [Streptomyces tendae]
MLLAPAVFFPAAFLAGWARFAAAFFAGAFAAAFFAGAFAAAFFAGAFLAVFRASDGAFFAGRSPRRGARRSADSSASPRSSGSSYSESSEPSESRVSCADAGCPGRHTGELVADLGGAPVQPVGERVDLPLDHGARGRLAHAR